MKKESVPYVVIFTLLVCLVFVTPLALADAWTKPFVEANRRYAAHVAVLKAFGLADEETSKEEVERLYAAIEELPAGAPTAWKTEIDGVPCVAAQATGPGLWASITLIVAADAAGTGIRGMEILSQAETPGLGGRIGEDWFKEQFRGERLGAGPVFVRVDALSGGTGDKDPANGKVDGITGATRTSDFTQAVVNAAIAELRKIGGGQ